MKFQKEFSISDDFFSNTANVFVLGARGFTKRYGGWETFVHGLIDNYPDSSHRFFVFEIVSKPSEQGVLYFDQVCCLRVCVRPVGNLSMVIFDRKCTKIAIAIIKKYKVIHPSIFFLGPRVGPYIHRIRKVFSKNGIRTIENPAGIEWKRSKWNFFVKKYVKASSFLMADSVNVLTCDSQAVADVYKKMNVRSRVCFIPYGCYPFDPKELKDPQNILKQWGLQKNDFFLVLGRFVPENNVEIILDAYLCRNRDKKLVFVSNIDKESKYFRVIEKKYSKNAFWKNVVFISSCYEKEKILALRSTCVAYIHGHSVGGTNPGLLEAMAVTNVSFLYDCPFNKEVGGDYALYFSDAKTLDSLLCKTISEDYSIYLGEKAKERMKSLYSWKDVCQKYSSIFAEGWGEKFMIDQIVLQKESRSREVEELCRRNRYFQRNDMIPNILGVTWTLKKDNIVGVALQDDRKHLVGFIGVLGYQFQEQHIINLSCGIIDQSLRGKGYATSFFRYAYSLGDVVLDLSPTSQVHSMLLKHIPDIHPVTDYQIWIKPRKTRISISFSEKKEDVLFNQPEWFSNVFSDNEKYEVHFGKFWNKDGQTVLAYYDFNRSVVKGFEIIYCDNKKFLSDHFEEIIFLLNKKEHAFVCFCDHSFLPNRTFNGTMEKFSTTNKAYAQRIIKLGLSKKGYLKIPNRRLVWTKNKLPFSFPLGYLYTEMVFYHSSI